MRREGCQRVRFVGAAERCHHIMQARHSFEPGTLASGQRFGQVVPEFKARPCVIPASRQQDRLQGQFEATCEGMQDGFSAGVISTLQNRTSEEPGGAFKEECSVGVRRF